MGVGVAVWACVGVIAKECVGGAALIAAVCVSEGASVSVEVWVW